MITVHSVCSRCILVLFLATILAPLPSRAEEFITIGHPACLSGRFAASGFQAHAGIKACIQWINEEYGGVEIKGKKMKLDYLYRDCRSEKEQVSRIMDQLISRHKAEVIFAPYSSELSWRGLPQAESRGILYMVHGGADDAMFHFGFKYAVQTIGPASLYHHNVLEMLHGLDPSATDIALIHEDSDFARRVRAGTVQKAQALGMKIVYNKIYPSGCRSLLPLVKPLQELQPDLILGGGHYRDGVLLCRHLAELDLRPGVISIIASATLPDFHEDLGPLAQGIMGPSQWELDAHYSAEQARKEDIEWFGPSKEKFLELFQKAAAVTSKPGYHAAEAGAQVLAYVLGVERAGSLDPDRVRAALGELRFMSFYGIWDINAFGLQEGHSMLEIQWQNGKREIVWPLEARTAEPLYPKPPFRAERERGRRSAD